MVEPQSTTLGLPANPALTGLARQLARCDRLLRQHPDAEVAEVRETLADEIEVCAPRDRAEALIALVRAYLNAIVSAPRIPGSVGTGAGVRRRSGSSPAAD